MTTCSRPNVIMGHIIPPLLLLYLLFSDYLLAALPHPHLATLRCLEAYLTVIYLSMYTKGHKAHSVSQEGKVDPTQPYEVDPSIPWSASDGSAPQWPTCKRCPDSNTYKSTLTKHCSDCGRCRSEMDHHCPWLATCVSTDTHRAFIHFLALVPVVIAFAIYPALPVLRTHVKQVWEFSVSDPWVREHFSSYRTRWMLGPGVFVIQMSLALYSRGKSHSPFWEEPSATVLISAFYGVMIGFISVVLLFVSLHDLREQKSTILRSLRLNNATTIPVYIPSLNIVLNCNGGVIPHPSISSVLGTGPASEWSRAICFWVKECNTDQVNGLDQAQVAKQVLSALDTNPHKVNVGESGSEQALVDDGN